MPIEAQIPLQDVVRAVYQHFLLLQAPLSRDPQLLAETCAPRTETDPEY